MAGCKLNLHIRKFTGGADPLSLLETLAMIPGDLAMLHSGLGGNLVVATGPIASVIMETNENQITLRCGGLAEAVADGAQRVVVNVAAAWRYWQEVLAGISFMQLAPELVGWLGWISYEAGVMTELPQLYEAKAATISLVHWQLFERYFLFDASTQQWSVVAVSPDAAHAVRVADEMVTLLCDAAKPGAACAARRATDKSELLYQPDAGKFKAAVAQCREYIAAGDIYQANISAPWTARVKESGYRLFARLVTHNPAQYAAFMRYGEHEIISASPELFLQRKGKSMETRPIKGTRPRCVDNSTADEQLRANLLHSAKDRAELAMIVDLLRNDLGRVCTRVWVEKDREVEKLPTLWHTYGVVAGELDSRLGRGWGHVIEAMCPGGSISGVPKIRAMRIIAELEDQPRGIYCGNIGWISPSGEGALNIAIRTIYMANGVAHFRSGAGITADSNPDEEYAEILVKAAALLKTLGMG